MQIQEHLETYNELMTREGRKISKKNVDWSQCDLIEEHNRYGMHSPHTYLY